MKTRNQKHEQLKNGIFNLVLSELSDRLMSVKIITKTISINEKSIIVKSSPSVMIKIGSWVDNPSTNYRDLSKISLMYGGFYLSEKEIDIANPNFINEIIQFINNAPRWKSQATKGKNVK